MENCNYVIKCFLDENGKPISGGIKSAGRFDQTYGLYHIRFKMPKTNAMWFAFWLMSYGMGEEFYDEYHDVWYLWDENGYQLFIDGLSEKNRKFNFSGEEHGEGTCQVPCYMILSVEYGVWGGALDETQFPFKIYVDSVSVYAKNQK